MARKEEKKEKMHFGSQSISNRKSRKTHDKMSNPPILDRGVSVTIFAKKKMLNRDLTKQGQSLQYNWPQEKTKYRVLDEAH